MNKANLIKKGIKAGMGILLFIILLTCAVSFVLVYVNTHPPRYPLHIPPSEFGAEYEDVYFDTEDGIRLSGWLVKPAGQHFKNPSVIICHGLGANKSDFTQLAAYLAGRGYIVLLFDFRAHGGSKGFRSSLGYHEQKDVAAAYKFLVSRKDVDAERIGIYGFSMGGAVAILQAAETGLFKAVIADSAFTSLEDQARDAIVKFYKLPAFPFLHLAILGYELYFQTSVEKVSAIDAIGRLSPAPVLLIAGEEDRIISSDSTRRLFGAAGHPKELWIIPDAGHGGTMAAGIAYYERVAAFFDRYIK